MHAFDLADVPIADGRMERRAPWNIDRMCMTMSTSQLLLSDLHPEAPLNISYMLATWLTTRLLMAELKAGTIETQTPCVHSLLNGFDGI